MNTNILALVFLFVMLGISWFNRISDSKSRPADYMAAKVASISPAPSPVDAVAIEKTSAVESSTQDTVLQSLQSPPAPNISARSYLLLGSRRGMLIERNSGYRAPIASVSKLMTALVFSELFPEDGALEIQQSREHAGEKWHGLLPGDILTKTEALKFLLIASNNVVAEAMAGASGREEFVRVMNRRALDIGMTQTLFVDPSGLTPMNRSNASDLIMLLRYLDYNAPAILDITRSPYITIEAASGKTYNLANTNLLLSSNAGIVGGKTGYTDLAGGCLVLVFDKGGERFYAAILGSPDRFQDMQKLIRYAE